MILTGLPNKKIKGLQCRIDLNDLDISVNVRAKYKKDGSGYEQEFRFQVDPFDLGAAFLLALAGRKEALFTWMGVTASEDQHWVMSTYWFSRDAKQAAINFLTDLKQKSEVDSKRLNSLIKQLSRDRLFALRLDPLTGGDTEQSPSFIFPLSNMAIARNLSEIRVGGSTPVRLIGGLRVVLNDGSVSLSAGNSSLFALSEEQRTNLSLSLQRLLEADAVMGMRMGEVSFFVPRGEAPLWERGVRISVLGRTVSITNIKDIARLLAVI